MSSSMSFATASLAAAIETQHPPVVAFPSANMWAPPCSPLAWSCPISGRNSTSLREQHESKLLVKCMLECYRAHPGQVAMLMDMAAVFLYPTPVDFTFFMVGYLTLESEKVHHSTTVCAVVRSGISLADVH